MKRLNVHRPTARCILRWEIEVEPSANGPIELEAFAPTMEEAMEQVRLWLAKTRYKDAKFVSVKLAGEVLDPEQL